MKRYRKIRGHSRIQKDIEAWKNYNLELDFENLEDVKRDYCKIWVSPFGDISVSGSEIPLPKGKNRKLILEGLLAVFNSWEKQLKRLNKPYYLAIWLFEPDIVKSQVVCAIDEMLDFYNKTFYRPEKQLKMPAENHGAFKEEIETFNWVFAHDDNYFTNDDLKMEIDEYVSEEDYYASQKWYKRKLKENPRSFTDEYGRTSYYIRRGTVWIGTK